MSQPAPGWYPDPAGTQRLRWWNGGMWLDQYQPMPGAAPDSTASRPAQCAGSAGLPRPAPGGGSAGLPHPADGFRSRPAHALRPAGTDRVRRPVPRFGDDPDLRAAGHRLVRRDGSRGFHELELRQGVAHRDGRCVALTVVFAVTAVYTGMLFAKAGNELSDAESEQTSAQQELDQAKSDLDQAKKELEEAQK